MTQYSANPISTKKVEAPKKGTLVTFRKPDSAFLFFKIQGGGPIPSVLEGGWISQVDADKAADRYAASKRKPKKGEVQQESDRIVPVAELATAAA